MTKHKQLRSGSTFKEVNNVPDFDVERSVDGGRASGEIIGHRLDIQNAHAIEKACHGKTIQFIN